jgi:hypothetical protein
MLLDKDRSFVTAVAMTSCIVATQHARMESRPFKTKRVRITSSSRHFYNMATRFPIPFGMVVIYVRFCKGARLIHAVVFCKEESMATAIGIIITVARPSVRPSITRATFQS